MTKNNTGHTSDSNSVTPLESVTILVTRPREQAQELVCQLERFGAEIVICPTIEIAAPSDIEPLIEAVRNRNKYDWIVFTSVNGVRFFAEYAHTYQTDSTLKTTKTKYAAIGPATAKKAENEGFSISLIPKTFVAESVIDEFLTSYQTLEGQRFLLPRADRARPLLGERLREHGAEVHEIVAYTTHYAQSMPRDCSNKLKGKLVDIVTFTSSSTVEGFFRLLERENIDLDKDHIRAASIGPITTSTLIKHGWSPAVEAKEYTISGLVQAITSQQP